MATTRTTIEFERVTGTEKATGIAETEPSMPTSSSTASRSRSTFRPQAGGPAIKRSCRTPCPTPPTDSPQNDESPRPARNRSGGFFVN